jgi:hypothetical protein
VGFYAAVLPQCTFARAAMTRTVPVAVVTTVLDNMSGLVEGHLQPTLQHGHNRHSHRTAQNDGVPYGATSIADQLCGERHIDDENAVRLEVHSFS